MSKPIRIQKLAEKIARLTHYGQALHVNDILPDIEEAYELGVAEERARLAAELCDVCKGLVVPAK